MTCYQSRPAIAFLDDDTSGVCICCQARKAKVAAVDRQHQDQHIELVKSRKAAAARAHATMEKRGTRTRPQGVTLSVRKRKRPVEDVPLPFP